MVHQQMASQEITVAYLGPAGSYTHQAALGKFGNSVTYHPQATIDDVFKFVEEKHTTYGVVPFENSTFGSVVTTLDRLVSSKTQIIGEAYLEVNHNLLAKSNIKSVKRIYSHPQAFGQCRKWINTHLKGAQCIDASSTSRAAELAASESASAAISSIVCAELYGLNVLEKDIQDLRGNKTRFFILGNSPSGSTGDDRTLLLFTVDHRKPGALCDCLKTFKDHNINLTKIDSRPSLQRQWNYVFFVEFEGHKDDSNVRMSLNDIGEYCLGLTVLGSYSNKRTED
ncbi:5049_t:CDS:2 [Acaulospora morrowiae]|uniref:prephenate dehydratase n=1 Tax=Acaulospora morrowiae TaxID=94023 RepID=A0A9N9A3H6_9GLOM|nr:5049_t:CDS:2 [Acaulospora morrowiae]